MDVIKEIARFLSTAGIGCCCEQCIDIRVHSEDNECLHPDKTGQTMVLSKHFLNMTAELPGYNGSVILHIGQNGIGEMITLQLDHWSSNPRGPIRRGKSGGFAWKQGGIWENVNDFLKTKRRKYPQYTSEWGCVIMCKSKRPFIPTNDYSEFISL